MASEIKLTPEQMRRKAKKYADESKALATSIKNMDTLIKALEAEWKGDASKAYVSRYNTLKPAFKNCKELMDELSANLNQSAQIMEETDRKIANQLK